MFATDFIFNGRKASDFGLMLCTWNEDDDVAEGGNIEPNAVKPPSRDVFDWYGGQFNEPLVWKTSVCKLLCKDLDTFDDDFFVSIKEERQISRWLMQAGYKWTCFMDEREGSEDIWYKCNVAVTPHQMGGKTVGFDLIFTSNCAYGFTGQRKYVGTISSSKDVVINISTDINEYVYPEITLSGSVGDIQIYNASDKRQNLENNKATKIKVNGDVVMDSNNDIVTGISNPDEDFNYYFIHLVDGENTIKTTSSAEIDIEINYREARRVIL